MIHNGLKGRLSAMDAFFLHIEREEAPMSVGCAAVFNGSISFKRFVAYLKRKITGVPRYLQKIQLAPLNIGQPRWVYDRNFDISRHVFEVTVHKPGGDSEFRTLAASLYEKPLDRSKPLWEIYLVKGLSGGRTGLVTKVHHCMVDGIAGIDLMFALFDTTPEVQHTKPHPVEPPRPQALSERLSNTLLDAAIDRLQYWTHVQKELNRFGEGAAFSQVLGALGAFAETMGGFLSPIRRLPFNKPFSGKRKLAWGSFSFAEARSIRTACGGTFNDVILAVLMGAIQRFVEELGETVKDRDFRILVPVNLRREDERGAMGNKITFLPLVLPLDVHDPVERIHEVHESMQSMRRKRVPEAINVMFTLLEGTVAPVQATLLHSATTPAGRNVLNMLYHVPPLHMICTNVPGPQIPLYCLGHPLEGFYPLVPATLDMGITCGITTYNQTVFYTFIADANAAPNVGILGRYFEEEFIRLRVRAEVEERVRIEFEHATRKGVPSVARVKGRRLAAKSG